MKKVGIITIHNSSNYGASLQSYALFEYIREQGVDCEIIDVHRPVNEDYVYERNYKSFRNNPFTLKKRVRNFIRTLLREKTQIFTSPLAEQRFNTFNAAIHYSRPYTRLSELKKNPPIYDLYISGSDQLWNPAQPYCLEPYFLTFVPEGKKKISYATSIGITELTKLEKNRFKEWLASYDAISVREKQAQQLLNSFVGKEVITVADPTFLLDVQQWKDLARYPEIRDKYIAVFLLSSNPKLIQYAIRLRQESGYKLIFLKQKQLQNSNNYIVDNEIGPQEFLGYLGNASLVVTDSFHGTVFSILMGADNLFSYIHPNNKRGSRIIDLLETFGMEDHLLPVDLNVSFAQLQSLRIDHSQKAIVIEKEKQRSRDFLDKWIR